MVWKDSIEKAVALLGEGKLQAAKNAFNQAASEATGNERAITFAYLACVHEQLGQSAEAEHYSAEARQMLEIAKMPEAEYELLHKSLGLRFGQCVEQSKYSEAITVKQLMMELAEAQFGAQDTKVERELVELAWVYNKSGKIDEAISYFESLLQTKGMDTVRLHAVLADCYTKQEQTDKAACHQEHCQEVRDGHGSVLQPSPGGTIILPEPAKITTAWQGEIDRYEKNLKAGRRSDAEKALDRALIEAKGDVRLRALTYQRRAQLQRAFPQKNKGFLMALELLAEDLPAEFQLLSESTARYISFCSENRAYENALEWTVRFVELAQDMADPPDYRLASALTLHATVCLDLNRFDYAQQVLEKALRLLDSQPKKHQGLVEVHRLLSDCYGAQGDLKAAQYHDQKRVEFEGFFRSIQDTSSAEISSAVTTQAESASPPPRPVDIKQAVALFEAGKLKAAKDAFDQAVSETTGNQSAIAFAYLACTHDELNDQTAAEHYSELARHKFKIVQLPEAEYKLLHKSLGLRFSQCVDHSKYSEAIAVKELMLEAAKAQFGASDIKVEKELFELAWICNAAGKTEDAIKYFQRMLVLKDVDTHRIHAALVDCYEELGNNDKAAYHLERCQELRGGQGSVPQPSPGGTIILPSPPEPQKVITAWQGEIDRYEKNLKAGRRSDAEKALDRALLQAKGNVRLRALTYQKRAQIQVSVTDANKFFLMALELLAEDLPAEFQLLSESTAKYISFCSQNHALEDAHKWTVRFVELARDIVEPPDDRLAKALTLHGRVCVSLGKVEDAERFLEEALGILEYQPEIHLGRSEVHRLLSDCYAAQGNVKSAQYHDQKRIEFELPEQVKSESPPRLPPEALPESAVPQQPPAPIDLKKAVALFEAGKLQAGRDAFVQAASEQTGNQRAVVFAFLACACDDLNDQPSAEHYSELARNELKIELLTAEDYELLHKGFGLRIVQCVRQGLHSEAIAVKELMLLLAKAQFGAGDLKVEKELFELAWICGAAGKTADAINHFESMLVLKDVDTQRIHTALAGCYEQLGQMHKAEYHRHLASEAESTKGTEPLEVKPQPEPTYIIKLGLDETEQEEPGGNEADWKDPTTAVREFLAQIATERDKDERQVEEWLTNYPRLRNPTKHLGRSIELLEIVANGELTETRKLRLLLFLYENREKLDVELKDLVWVLNEASEPRLQPESFGETCHYLILEHYATCCIVKVGMTGDPESAHLLNQLLTVPYLAMAVAKDCILTRAIARDHTRNRIYDQLKMRPEIAAETDAYSRAVTLIANAAYHKYKPKEYETYKLQLFELLGKHPELKEMMLFLRWRLILYGKTMSVQNGYPHPATDRANLISEYYETHYVDPPVRIVRAGKKVAKKPRAVPVSTASTTQEATQSDPNSDSEPKVELESGVLKFVQVSYEDLAMKIGHARLRFYLYLKREFWDSMVPFSAGLKAVCKWLWRLPGHANEERLRMSRDMSRLVGIKPAVPAVTTESTATTVATDRSSGSNAIPSRWIKAAVVAVVGIIALLMIRQQNESPIAPTGSTTTGGTVSTVVTTSVPSKSSADATVRTGGAKSPPLVTDNPAESPELELRNVHVTVVTIPHISERLHIQGEIWNLTAHEMSDTPIKFEVTDRTNSRALWTKEEDEDDPLGGALKAKGSVEFDEWVRLPAEECGQFRVYINDKFYASYPIGENHAQPLDAKVAAGTSSPRQLQDENQRLTLVADDEAFNIITNMIPLPALMSHEQTSKYRAEKAWEKLTESGKKMSDRDAVILKIQGPGSTRGVTVGQLQKFGEQQFSAYLNTYRDAISDLNGGSRRGYEYAQYLYYIGENKMARQVARGAKNSLMAVMTPQNADPPATGLDHVDVTVDRHSHEPSIQGQICNRGANPIYALTMSFELFDSTSGHVLWSKDQKVVDEFVPPLNPQESKPLNITAVATDQPPNHVLQFRVYFNGKLYESYGMLTNEARIGDDGGSGSDAMPAQSQIQNEISLSRGQPPGTVRSGQDENTRTLTKLVGEVMRGPYPVRSSLGVHVTSLQDIQGVIEALQGIVDDNIPKEIAYEERCLNSGDSSAQERLDEAKQRLPAINANIWRQKTCTTFLRSTQSWPGKVPSRDSGSKTTCRVCG